VVVCGCVDWAGDYCRKYVLVVGRAWIMVDSRKCMEGSQAKLSRCDPHAIISSATASANPSSNIGVNANLRNVHGASVEDRVVVRVLITPRNTP